MNYIKYYVSDSASVYLCISNSVQLLCLECVSCGVRSAAAAVFSCGRLEL